MDGVALKDWVLLILGNVLLIIIAVRAVGYFAKREWGELVTHLVAAIIVGAIVYLPDQSINAIKQISGLLF